MKKLLIGALALGLAACGQSGGGADSSLAGDWKVAPDQSRVAFATIKQGTVVEPHHFSGVSGDVKADGTATVTLDLTSLVTQPETRFTRMQEHLFQVATYPNATITTKLQPAAYEGMAVGERRTVTIPVNVEMVGQQAEYEAEVFVTRAGPDTIVVDSARPVIVEAADLQLTQGVEKLRELAELKAITPAIPVTFSITFTR